MQLGEAPSGASREARLSVCSLGKDGCFGRVLRCSEHRGNLALEGDKGLRHLQSSALPSPG